MAEKKSCFALHFSFSGMRVSTFFCFVDCLLWFFRHAKRQEKEKKLNGLNTCSFISQVLWSHISMTIRLFGVRCHSRQKVMESISDVKGNNFGVRSQEVRCHCRQEFWCQESVSQMSLQAGVLVSGVSKSDVIAGNKFGVRSQDVWGFGCNSVETK